MFNKMILKLFLFDFFIKKQPLVGSRYGSTSGKICSFFVWKEGFITQ